MASSVYAQQKVQVIDIYSREPISNVAIKYNGNHLFVTNKHGVFNLKHINDSDTLHFFHVSYQYLKLSVKAIKKENYQVTMTPSIYHLSDVVVSASKFAQSADNVVQQIFTLDEERILLSQPQTSADLLLKSGNIFVQKSQLGGGSPFIRGFSANSVLITIDGIRFNNAIFRSGNIHNIISIDPSSIRKVEILMGPGSVIYGSDALGGIMNFITKDPFPSKYAKKRLNVGSWFRYSSANRETTYHIDMEVVGNHWGSYTNLTLESFGDLRSGTWNAIQDYTWGSRRWYVERLNNTDMFSINSNSTIQRASGYNKINLMQKILYQPNPDNTWRYMLLYSKTGDIPRYDRLSQFQEDPTKTVSTIGEIRVRGQSIGRSPVYSEWYYGPLYWLSNMIQWKASSLPFIDDFKTTFAYQIFKESRHVRRYNQLDKFSRWEHVDAVTFNVDILKNINKGSMVWGAEVVYNYVKSTGIKQNILTLNTEKTSTRYPDGGSRYNTYASFFKYDQEIMPWLSTTVGLRYSYYHLASRFVDKDIFAFPFEDIKIKNGSFDWSLGLLIDMKKYFQWNLSFSTGFRSPNVDDAAKVFDSVPGTLILPNPNLSPTKSYNFDLLWRYRRRSFRFEFNTFYTRITDFFVPQKSSYQRDDGTLISIIPYEGVDSEIYVVGNSGQAYIYGIGFLLHTHVFKNFEIRTSMTYTKGEAENDEPLRHIPPLFGHLTFDYQTKAYSWELDINFNGIKHREDIPENELAKQNFYTNEGVPSFYTINLRSHWHISANVGLNINLENLFDIHYRTYSSGISMAGRNLIVTLNFKY